MKTKRLFVIVAIILAGSLAGLAQTVTCPSPANQVVVNVTATVTFDSSSKLFTYSYSVKNDPSSLEDVSDFAVFFSPKISDIAAPQGWAGAFFGFSQQHDQSVMGWNALQTAPIDPSQPPPGELQAGLNQIKPGTSVSGFSFKSSLPTGPVKYFVKGFVQPNVAQTEAEAEALGDLCPQIQGDFFTQAVMGTTQGPVSFIPVSIEIKPPAAPPIPAPRPAPDRGGEWRGRRGRSTARAPGSHPHGGQSGPSRCSICAAATCPAAGPLPDRAAGACQAILG